MNIRTQATAILDILYMDTPPTPQTNEEFIGNSIAATLQKIIRNANPADLEYLVALVEYAKGEA